MIWMIRNTYGPLKRQNDMFSADDVFQTNCICITESLVSLGLFLIKTTERICQK